MNLDKVRWYVSFLVPVMGVSFFDWNVFTILLFFWVESFLQGLFFVLKGLVGVYYSRKIKGIYFLIFFSLLYFIQLFVLVVLVGDVGEYFHAIQLPSFLSLGIGIMSLIVPNITELKNLSRVLKKVNPTVKDLGPVVDLFFDFKETMLRIFILWLTLPFVFGIIFADAYWKFPLLVTEIVVIIIFTTVRFLFDSYSKKQRESVEKQLKN